MGLPKTISLNPAKRVLFLTKDLTLIKKQLYEGLNLKIDELSPHDLLDDINTDIMTPAWVCFHHDPHEIAKKAYAGLLLNGERIFKDGALMDGQFEAIVSGERKGTGSSRETAAQCEVFSGIRMVFAASFAPIHQKNNINLGQLMGGYDLLRRLQRGESIPLMEFLAPFDDMSQKILSARGLFAFLKKNSPRINQNSCLYKTKNMTMAQKIMAIKISDSTLEENLLKHESIIVQVDGGYSHEFTSAQVHQFLKREFGEGYKIKNRENFAAFEDHLIYAEMLKKNLAFMEQIKELRQMQKEFIRHNNIKDYSAIDGLSPGICHEVAREDLINPGDLIEATDSHTCMGGALNAFAFGVGATEYAGILATGLAITQVPKSIRFDLLGELRKNCTAKDVMLYILLNFAKKGLTLNTVMEFGGKGLKNLSIDERATLCNMATECGAKTGICEPDERLLKWLISNRPEQDEQFFLKRFCLPDSDCHYEAGRFSINLQDIEPMVAHPGDPDQGIPSDPTNGELIKNLGSIPIDIAYGGSCTAGKFDDIEMYAKVVSTALKQGKKLPNGVRFFIQYGSKKVEHFSKTKGFHQVFMAAGIKAIAPGCGACIGCGPGVSENPHEVSISAINRNFQGRSGPGKLYLASPLTVAASAFAGKIVAWDGDDGQM